MAPCYFIRPSNDDFEQRMKKCKSFEGVRLAGVTCQNRKCLNMPRQNYTCFLTRFLLLEELGEANTLQDNKRF